MAIWNTASVEDQPSLVLRSWRVYEVEDESGPEHSTRHFVGYVDRNAEGRASSAIQSFDKNTMRGVTRSGRVYELAGPSGVNGDAMYVWEHWKRINQVTKVTDITNEILQ